MSRTHFEPMAAKWEQQGRPDDLLPSNSWQLLALVCWIQSKGAQAQGVSAALSAFHAASVSHFEAIVPGWFEEILSQREFCERCGETYRIENLGLCSQCMWVCCAYCRPLEKALNGNQAHWCGGEIVG
jgi:hypothetical protein